MLFAAVQQKGRPKVAGGNAIFGNRSILLKTRFENRPYDRCNLRTGFSIL
jgi:hypothetical protein